MDYYEELRKGICPECKNTVIKVEETTEYETREGKEVPVTFTVIRCTRCGKSWLPNVLLTKQS